MSAYRTPPARLSLAPPAPWWRLLWARARGRLRALPWARANRAALVAYRRSWGASMPPGWIPRGYPLALETTIRGAAARPLLLAVQELHANAELAPARRSQARRRA